MQVDNRSNYNTLGRMGPLYPRPEYRPPQKNAAELGGDGSVKGEGADKKTQKEKEAVTLSASLKGKGAKKPEAPGKLTLQAAKGLVEETGAEIAALSPKSVNGCPHGAVDGSALMWPFYA